MTSYRGGNAMYHTDSLFSNKSYNQNSKAFEFRLSENHFNSHILGDYTSISTLQWTGLYNNFVDDNSGLPYSTITTSGTKTGEWIQFDFPFWLKLSTFTYRNQFTGVTMGWVRVHIVATNDVNSTWDYLGVINSANNGVGTNTLNIISTPSSYGYKHYRLIVDKIQGGRSWVENLFFYGYIYTL